MAACAATVSAELLFAAAHRTETVELRGEGGDGVWDARRQAAESQILLVMAMDHIDPPVRKQVHRIVAPGMQTTITNRRQWSGTIDIRRRLIGRLLSQGPAHRLCGARLTQVGRDTLSFVHLHTVSPDRMRQNESAGLNSFRIEISAIFVRCAKSSRRTANASSRRARQDTSRSSSPVARLGSRPGCWRRRGRQPGQNIP